MLADLWRCINE